MRARLAEDAETKVIRSGWSCACAVKPVKRKPTKERAPTDERQRETTEGISGLASKIEVKHQIMRQKAYYHTYQPSPSDGHSRQCAKRLDTVNRLTNKKVLAKISGERRSKSKGVE